MKLRTIKDNTFKLGGRLTADSKEVVEKFGEFYPTGSILLVTGSRKEDLDKISKELLEKDNVILLELSENKETLIEELKGFKERVKAEEARGLALYCGEENTLSSITRKTLFLVNSTLVIK